MPKSLFMWLNMLYSVPMVKIKQNTGGGDPPLLMLSFCDTE